MSQKRSPSPLLEPPRRTLEDPGAHDLESSDNEDEHFSDASEGQLSQRSAASGRNSPIPITRVEKVDDTPSHGEVPGTDAYKMRMQDAVPDEVEVSTRSRSASQVSASRLPVESPIPVTVVEKIDPVAPSHGEVPGTAAHHIRSADAEPDLVVQAPEVSRRSLELPQHDTDFAAGSGAPPKEFSMSASDRSSSQANSRSSMNDNDFEHQGPRAGVGGIHIQDAETDRDGADDDDLGDDFDDFEEGGDDADDFGDFGDGFSEAEQTPLSEPDIKASKTDFHPRPLSQFPLMDFEKLRTPEDVISAAATYIEAIYPSKNQSDPSPSDSTLREDPVFLTERSASLYSQLLAPPPLLPPNWIRSRIRRLFLVSLGVPVDLDEILPASKQKKLVLPSINLGTGKSDPLRLSSETRGVQDSGASFNKQRLSSSGSRRSASTSRKRKGPPPAPDLDLVRARTLCETTAARLADFSDEDLIRHVETLEGIVGRAVQVDEYWLARKDGALREKEAFEGVIENLVKHARRVRK